ncbi:alpha/beta fold hydrolase [Allofustis seminis]|uniref:alpha/beta fold hydrolase n=1 Tax=Allofustis seminis TaxID=166939 RepID=UPI00036FAC49|nr:alpha/beta fold hydrolase [Allofustis seminis]
MKQKIFTFQSYSKLTNISATSFIPKDSHQIKGVVQIIHGMAEHKERYFPFMKKLTEAGYAAYIMDLPGHGQSVSDSVPLGYFGPEGVTTLLQDVRQLNEIIHQQLPHVPLFIFGHSMGSFIARIYVAQFRTTYQGAIFCGTSGKNHALPFAILLAKIMCQLKGPYHPSHLLNDLAFASYNKKTKKCTSFDWLSLNEDNVSQYVADPLCGFIFTNNGFYTLFSLLKCAQSKQCMAQLPSGIPFLLIAGAEDPVGQYGKGVRQVYNQLKRHQFAVDLILYPKLRHEILLEQSAPEVFQDVIHWLNRQIDAIS